MYIEYSCKDEDICDTCCPNKDCILVCQKSTERHSKASQIIILKTNIKGELTNDTNNNNANSGRQSN